MDKVSPNKTKNEEQPLTTSREIQFSDYLVKSRLIKKK